MLSTDDLTGGWNHLTAKAPSASGKLSFEFSATDSAGYGATTTATIVVNSPPAMTPVAPVAATSGQAVTGSVRAVDPDGDSITYVAINAPPGFALPGWRAGLLLLPLVLRGARVPGAPRA